MMEYKVDIKFPYSEEQAKAYIKQLSIMAQVTLFEVLGAELLKHIVDRPSKDPRGSE